MISSSGSQAAPAVLCTVRVSAWRSCARGSSSIRRDMHSRVGCAQSVPQLRLGLAACEYNARATARTEQLHGRLERAALDRLER